MSDLRRVAANYLKKNNRSFGQFLPATEVDRSAIPDTPDVAKLVSGYKGREAVAEGEVFDASPANIDQRTERFTLANGAKVALLSKRTRGQSIKGILTLHLGDEKSLFGKTMTAELTADMLMRGTSKLTRAEIDERLEQLKTKLYIYSAGQNVTVQFDTVRKHLPEVLTLLREVLRAPGFAKAEFDLLIKKNLADLDTTRNEPKSVANRAMAQLPNTLYTKGDIRYVASLDDAFIQIKAAQLAEIKRFYRAFYGASDAELALVGDFAGPQVRAQLAGMIGDWKSPVKYARAPKLVSPPQGASQTLETPDNANAFYVARLALGLKDDSPEYAELLVVNKILGGGVRSRLFNRLRQADGLSYGAGSQLSVSAYEPVSSLLVYAMYAP